MLLQEVGRTAAITIHTRLLAICNNGNTITISPMALQTSNGEDLPPRMVLGGITAIPTRLKSPRALDRGDRQPWWTILTMFKNLDIQWKYHPALSGPHSL